MSSLSSQTNKVSTKCVWRLAAIVYIAMVAFAHAQSATNSPFPADGSDLDVFISRPDLRPPKLHVHIYEPHLASPGYWFVAPYGDLLERPPTNVYQPLQNGPHIYDNAGNLVWSGAHLAEVDRPVQDFKVSIVNSVPCLSMIVMKDGSSRYHPSGVGLILNASFDTTHEVHTRRGSGHEDMHEFNIIENGKSALMIVHQITSRQVFREGYSESLRSVLNSGFVQVDLATGKVVFEWWALDHIDPLDSFQKLPNRVDVIWDWFHPNSVDKDQDGDYLLSARYTDTIYKISGKDGSILWRLGGDQSTFSLKGFNFSAQHHARFHEPAFRDRNETTTQYITFLDNAAEDGRQSSRYSQGVVVALDSTERVARLAQAYPRPDQGLTRLRGNFQLLPNSNVLAGWSESAYMSEYTASGKLILEAAFTSNRFNTYRTYKFNFTGRPTTKPDLRAIAHHVSGEISTTALYVSWNGATEVTAWRFFARRNSSSSSSVGFEPVATVRRQGFETSYVMLGSPDGGCYAEAIAADGEVLGTSLVEIPFATGGTGAKSSMITSTGDLCDRSIGSDKVRRGADCLLIDVTPDPRLRASNLSCIGSDFRGSKCSLISFGAGISFCLFVMQYSHFARSLFKRGMRSGTTISHTAKMNKL